MALNNSTADACATSMASAMGITDGPTIDQMKVQIRALYASLKNDIAITVTVTSVSGVTPGGGVSGPGTGTGVPQ
jgi:hypothetical protein